MKKILIGLIVLVVSITSIYYVSLVFAFNLDLKADFALQEKRLEQLRLEPNQAVVESDFANFDLDNNTLRLNEVQVLATHNSYKTMPNMYFSKVIEVIWGQKVRNGHYGMPFLTDQLDSGIRGLELDITMYGDDFILIHDPITDWRSNGPSLRLALEEIKIWSDVNQNHAPINLMFQVRSTFSPFSNKFGGLTQGDLIALDALFEEIFGADMITPGEVKAGHSTLRQAVEIDGWPLFNDCKGKVYVTFLFDDKKAEQAYVNLDPTFSTQKGFIFARLNEGLKDYTAVILADNAFEEGLADLVSKNYILRTRIDEQFSHPEDRFKASIELGSVILATDYPEGNTYDNGYVCRLTTDGKTIIQRGSIVFD